MQEIFDEQNLHNSSETPVDDEIPEEDTIDVKVNIFIEKKSKGMTGIRISPKYESKGVNETLFGYYSDGFRGGYVEKTNGSGKVKAKIGYLWTSTQWFYDYVVNTTLKHNGSSVQYRTTSSFYKMVTIANDKRGASHTAKLTY